jgi:hypothetical protein
MQIALEASADLIEITVEQPSGEATGDGTRFVVRLPATPANVSAEDLRHGTAIKAH